MFFFCILTSTSSFISYVGSFCSYSQPGCVCVRSFCELCALHVVAGLGSLDTTVQVNGVTVFYFSVRCLHIKFYLSHCGQCACAHSFLFSLSLSHCILSTVSGLVCRCVHQF